MKKVIIIFLIGIIKLIRYLSVLGIVVLFLGVFGVFGGGQYHNGNFALDYGNYVTDVSVLFPVVILFLAGLLMCLVYKITIHLENVLNHFRQGEFFIVTNEKSLQRVLYYLLSFTVVQLFIHFVLNYLRYDNVSDLFNLSIKDYSVNIIFILINYVVIKVIEHGNQLQKNYDEII